MGVFVRGESKFGSTDPVSSSCTATSVRSYQRRTAYTLAQHWRYAYRGFRRDLWTNARGLLGCRPHSPETCWVREGVSHPPPGTECRCVRIAVLRLCLSFNVSLSLSQPQSELFLHWILLGHCSELYHPRPMRLNIVQPQPWRVTGLCGGMQ